VTPPIPIVQAYARRLTGPIRAYLIAPCAGRHLIGALNLFFFPAMFPAAGTIPVVGTLPLPLWGTLFLTTGLFALTGALMNNRNVARVALIASFALTLAVGGGVALGTVVLAYFGGHPAETPYPMIATFILALAAADLCVLAGRWVPMTS
jgi:hypothetical protein